MYELFQLIGQAGRLCATKIIPLCILYAVFIGVSIAFAPLLAGLMVALPQWLGAEYALNNLLHGGFPREVSGFALLSMLFWLMVLAIFFAVCQAALNAGQIYILLFDNKNEGFKVGLINFIWQNFFKLALLNIIMHCLFYAGLALFIIPGLIAFVAFLFSDYYLLLARLGVRESIKASYRLVKSHYSELLFLVLIYFMLLFLIQLLLLGKSAILSLIVMIIVNAVFKGTLLLFYVKHAQPINC